MKFTIFFTICACMVLPSIAIPNNQKNSTNKGQFVSFEIFAKIDTKLVNYVKPIEKFIRSSSFRSFTPLPATSYHMTIYSIQKHCDPFIPPIKRWYNAVNGRIPNRCSKIPYEALEGKNSEAMCILKSDLNEQLKIKFASLNIGTTMITVSLQVETESLQRIQNVRRKFAKIYDNLDNSMEPVNDKLYIQLAYGKRNKVKLNDLNALNVLVRPFNGAKLSIPSIYLDNGDRYVEFPRNIDCGN